MKEPLKSKLTGMLDVVYPDLDSGFLAEKLLKAMGLAPNQEPPPAHQNNWDESDIVLITYADTIRRADEKPLVTLREFLNDYLADAISAVHILPFFPYSSDDGFSVMAGGQRIPWHLGGHCAHCRGFQADGGSGDQPYVGSQPLVRELPQAHRPGQGLLLRGQPDG